MNIRIKKGTPRGRVTAPPSKSMAHRMLICSALCDGVSRIYGVSGCDDVQATLDCMEAMGIRTEEKDGCRTVYGIDITSSSPDAPLNCRESGSTLRFLIPLAMLSGKTTMFKGAKSLMQRPLGVYEQLFSEKGALFISDGDTITVKGPIKSGDFNLVGNVSSQFITGLLFALPLLEGDSRIKIAPPIESRSYIELTRSAQEIFGVRTEWEDDYTIFIPGGQRYRAKDVSVEGDYSGSAFIHALNLFSGDVTVDGLREDSLQGDAVYKKFFTMLDAGIPTIHIGDCPDLGPILFAVAAAKCGGVFDGTRRLKIKESDRASAMAEELKKFGTSVAVYEDSVVVYPLEFHAPKEKLYGHNDHRIVMALSVLLTLTGGEIEGAEAVAKSYPDFFRDLSSLGIECEAI